VLEAIGGYELAVIGALAAVELPVVAVNPRQVRDFARATGQLAKTDGCRDLGPLRGPRTAGGAALGERGAGAVIHAFYQRLLAWIN
jgi:hypothetical protein